MHVLPEFGSSLRVKFNNPRTAYQEQQNLIVAFKTWFSNDSIMSDRASALNDSIMRDRASALRYCLCIFKSLASIFQVRRLQSVLLFSIRNHPWSFMIYYYLFGVFLS